MQIYCFEIDGEPRWPTGTAVAARDRRTAAPVLIYRSLPATSPGPVNGQRPDVPGESAILPEQLRRARAAVSSSLAPNAARTEGSGPAIELFTCRGFLALAASDARTAAPVLERLRAEGMFLEAPPPPPPLCSVCRTARPQANGVCAACEQKKKKVPPPAKKQPSRFRKWFGLASLVALIAGALYLWWPAPTPPPARVIPAPIVQFSASHQLVRKGSRVVISWKTSGISSLSIRPGIGAVAASGKRTIVVNHDTTFTLFGSGAGYTSPATVTVSVIKPGAEEVQPPAGDQTNSAQQTQETSPAPVVSSPQPTYVPPAPAASQSGETVRQALDAWAAAYRANDPSRQAALYAPQVERFFLREQVDNSFIQSYMTTFYARGTRFIDFTYTSAEASQLSPDAVKVTLVKHYVMQLAGGQVKSVDARSELHFASFQGRWKITFERDFKG